jgi:hypothetical protein
MSTPMNRAVIYRTLTSPPFIVLGAAFVVVGLLVGLFVGVERLMGPDLSVSRSGDVIVVEPRFLEYDLGITRLRLEDLDDDRVRFEATSDSDVLIPRVRLSRGTFDPLVSLGSSARLDPANRGYAGLVPGHRYRLTVWGNNGAGRITSSSIRFDG